MDEIYTFRYILCALNSGKTKFASLEPTCGTPYWSTTINNPEVKKFKTTDDAFNFFKKYSEYLLRGSSVEDIFVIDREPTVVFNLSNDGSIHGWQPHCDRPCREPNDFCSRGVKTDWKEYK